jgi:hypothetical protein
MVFILPRELNSLIMGHRKILYKLLFDASTQILPAFAKDQKHLGASPGIISVLHTWGQQLSFHPRLNDQSGRRIYIASSLVVVLLMIMAGRMR